MARKAFTLTELLIVISLIAILAGLALSALSSAVEQSKVQRTRAIITKLDSLIAEKWESYRTRPVPIRVPAGTTPINAARVRLYGLRELQRLELPDRISDLCTQPELTDLQADNKLDTINANSASMPALQPYGGTIPSVASGYKRRALRNKASSGNGWSAAYQGAECLYLIVSTMRDGDKSAIDFFSPAEIGDVDEDGMKEILDGWGMPIEFIRWPAGYTVQNQAITLQTSDASIAPDPFDPMKCDPRWADTTNTAKPFALTPLIFSGGPDKLYDIAVDQRVVWQANTSLTPPRPANDPFFSSTPTAIGTPADTLSDGELNYGDNLTNHYTSPE